MNQPALNPAQSVSVAASAGSGKTWLLSARMVRMLMAGVPHDRILALTFTRKAAGEMGQRVLERLRDMALADDVALDEELRRIELDPTESLRSRARQLYRQIALSPWPLRASTIHAFCQDIVTRFPQFTGIPPGFELAEQEAPLLTEAWEQAQALLLAQSGTPAAEALRTLIAEGHSEAKITEVVMGFLARRNEWRSYAQDQADPVQALHEDLKKQLAVTLQDDPITAVDNAVFNTVLQRFLEDLGTVGKVGRSVAYENLKPALTQRHARRLHTLRTGLFTKDGTKPYGFAPSQDVRKKLGARVDEWIAAHQSLIDSLESVHELQCRQLTLRRTLAGVTLGRLTLECLDRVLTERRTLPFAELEWKVSALLRQPEAGQWVQYKLDARIDHLLLDEFQDTSASQWQLLRPLLEEMAHDTSRERSAFIVGDVKQSIYGFRRAEPGLMPVAAQWLQQHLDGAEQPLHASRRSSPVIMEFVNALFQKTQAAELMPDFPTHATHCQSAWGRVECLPLVMPEASETEESDALRNPLTTPRADRENERALAEGRQIAARIKTLLASRAQVGAKSEFITYKDIMILLRSRTHQQAIERALTESEIPFIGAARGTLLETVEAQDLLALLRWLDAPWRDLDLAQVLRSPLFGASEDDLCALARAAAGRQTWFSVLAAQSAPVLSEAAAVLPRWIQQARTLPVHDLLDQLIAERNLASRYEQVLPKAQADRVRGNLSRLLQLALDHDKGRSPSIARFLSGLDQIDDRDAPNEAPPPAQSGPVRILTIHAAKGLEAAAVFVVQCGAKKSPHSTGWQVDWPPGDPRPRSLLLTSSRGERDDLSSGLLDAQKDREQREGMNLLYVAATRAKHFLHFSGFGSGKNSKETSWHDLAANALRTLEAKEHKGGLAIGTDCPPCAAAGETLHPDAEIDEALRLPIGGFTRPARASVPEPDAATVRHGIAVHALLQWLSEGQPATQLSARLHARIGALQVHEFEEWLREAKSVLTAPSLRPFFDPAALRRAWNEVPVSTEGGDHFIDRLVDDGTTLWVLDYKTHRSQDDAALLATYRGQLERYVGAVRQLWPERKIQAGLVLTATARWLPLSGCSAQQFENPA